MSPRTTDHAPTPATPLGRREALRRLGVLAAGLAVGCTPLRIVLKTYPDGFDRDLDLGERVLRAFVTAVVPGVPADDPDLVRVFSDPYYPFARYRAFFASDLCRRAEERFGTEAFDRLTLEQRTAVIRDGLGADATTRKLYTGAVFLAQIATYGAIYDDARGQPLIGFEGRYRFRGFADLTYPDPERFLARSLSGDGNPT
ncbi:MAG TPA: hypothetical protein VNI61_03320 [Gemmatimonadales bacterium]|nr:hypothetical protein [Gemmatimonadales bacterium]